MLRDFTLSIVMGNLKIYCYNSSGRKAFLGGSLENENGFFRCIHYNVAWGEMSELSVCVDLQ